jgi:tetratricopeptide (TPR) repeat protein
VNGLFAAFRESLERRKILRELRKLRANESEAVKFKVRDGLDEALSLLELDDRDKAAELWTALIDRHPQEVSSSPMALQVLFKLGRFDEAEALMQKGCRQNPRDGFFLTGLAEIAQARGDCEETVKRCVLLRKRFPAVVQGYYLAAISLATMNRVEEAEKLAEQAMEQFPEDVRGFLEYARVADRQKRWVEALRRWQVVREKFSGLPFGYMGCGKAMIHVQRFDEADAILSGARVRFPMDSALLTELARCAEARGDMAEAQERWSHRVERFPLELHGYCDAAAAFERLGQSAEAGAILQAAIDRFPTEGRPVAELANLAHRTGDESLRRNTPDDQVR